MTNKTNIAVCLYGQLRTGKYCLKNLKTVLEKSEQFNFDFFCATKDNSQDKTDDVRRKTLSQYDYNKLGGDLDLQSIHETFDIVNPIARSIISLSDGTDITVETGAYVLTTKFESLRLMEEHITKNPDKKYDFVLVWRYDCIPGHLQLLNIFNAIHERRYKIDTPLNVYMFRIPYQNNPIPYYEELFMIFDSSDCIKFFLQQAKLFFKRKLTTFNKIKKSCPDFFDVFTHHWTIYQILKDTCLTIRTTSELGEVYKSHWPYNNATIVRGYYPEILDKIDWECIALEDIIVLGRLERLLHI